jgi:hypothetical protein
MKTIADFKRSMVVGTKWRAQHRYIGEHPSEISDLGVRECVLNNSVDFGFKTATGNISHSSWPRKGEFLYRDGSVYITKKGFCELIYTKIEE